MLSGSMKTDCVRVAPAARIEVAEGACCPGARIVVDQAAENLLLLCELVSKGMDCLRKLVKKHMQARIVHGVVARRWHHAFA